MPRSQQSRGTPVQIKEKKKYHLCFYFFSKTITFLHMEVQQTNKSFNKQRQERKILFLFYYLYGALAEKETRNDDWTENRIMQFV